MKLTVSAQDLKRALNTCNEIAPVSSAIADQVTGVLIRAEEDIAVFTSFDETSSVKVEVPAKVQVPGEALVRCAAVASTVSATFHDTGFDGKPIEVKLERTSKSTLKISGSNKVAEKKLRPHIMNFPLLDTDFFVDPPPFEEAKATKFPAFQFMDGLSKVGPSASKDISKLHLNCISLTLTDNEVVFAATDGVQIAEFRKAAEVQGLRGSFILGLKFASVAAKLINPTFDFVDMYVEDDNIFIKTGGTTLVSTLLNTTFPDYIPFMSTEGLSIAVFPREAFLSDLSGMMPVVDTKTHRLVLEAQASGTATLSTSSDTGEAASFDLEVETPEDFVLHFNSALLQSTLRQLDGDEFEFYFSQDAKGVLLKSPKDEDFKAFVCTLRKVE